MSTAEELGIPQLDRVLASIPKGSTIALVNDPGVEGEAFLYQTAHHHLQKKRTIVYCVFNRPPSSAVRDMFEYGFEPAVFRDRLLFVDGYSSMLGGDEGAAYTLADPRDPKQFVATLAKVAKDHPDAVLIIDSLSTLADQSTPDNLVRALKDAKPTLQRFRLTTALMTKWPYGSGFQSLVEGFDAMISLHGVEDKVLLNQYFVVDRTRWESRVQAQPILYKTVRPGGVLVYIPKVLVTGPYHSGKTTFVQTLSDTAVSVNRLGTTVALDHGQITLDGLTANIFGTPGQERFDPLLKTLGGQALGVIIVVDSTRPDSFERAREMIQMTGHEGLPMIVAANKQDLPRALKSDEVARRVAAPPNVKVVPCVALDRESTRAVLRELLNRIMLKVVP